MVGNLVHIPGAPHSLPGVAGSSHARRMRFPVAALSWLSAACVTAIHAENWPCWRGPRLDGTSTDAGVPTTWSPTEHIAWKTPLPGLGHASPIVWGNRVFTVTCIPDREERVLLCLDRDTGRILWQQVVVKSMLEGKHPLNSHASSTPATDGERVYVSFLDVKEVVVAEIGRAHV